MLSMNTQRKIHITCIKTIKCPNQECSSNTGEKEREVIYIRYDDANMKYVYMCAHCNTMWKTSEQK